MEAEAVREPPECVLNADAVLLERVKAAVQLRQGLGLPGPGTDVYRLINRYNTTMRLTRVLFWFVLASDKVLASDHVACCSGISYHWYLPLFFGLGRPLDWDTYQSVDSHPVNFFTSM
jgi:hypothetical protein